MCPKTTQVHSYHDGELPQAQRAELEAHLGQCAECRGLLGELQALSQMLAAVPLPQVPASAMGRMRGSFHAAQAARERGVRRIAGWMTAAAAIVLVTMMVRTPAQRPEIVDTSNGSAWVEAVAVMPPSAYRDDSNADFVQLAQFMAGDLSLGQRQ